MIMTHIQFYLRRGWFETAARLESSSKYVIHIHVGVVGREKGENYYAVFTSGEDYDVVFTRGENYEIVFTRAGTVKI